MDFDVGQAVDTKNKTFSSGPKNYEDGMYVKGQMPFIQPKFVAKKTPIFRTPKDVIDLLYDIRNKKIQTDDAQQIISSKIKCLMEPLKSTNYCDRFHNLLYMEHVAQEMHMENYKMFSVYLQRKKEFLVLTVPGLPEKKPSLIAGDKAIITFPWENTGRAYEGPIHKTMGAEIFLKFEPQFHERYSREECDVEFKAMSSVIQRCHNGINSAMVNLGKDILFPVHVGEDKKPQYNFTEEGEEETFDLINCITDNYLESFKNSLNRRKIVWLNKQLNKYQKVAVKNILKGLARPLPYVIFGPPGTGKTVTMCEAVLQV